MDKILGFLGGKRNGTEKEIVFDIGDLLKLVLGAAVTVVSVSFAAGSYFAAGKDVPVRVDSLEKRVTLCEYQVGGVEKQLTEINGRLRDIQDYLMRRGK